MAYTSPSHVVGMRSRAMPRLVFLLVLLYGIWFTVVLVGEQQAFSSDPGAWAVLPTLIWAWIGLVLFFLAAIYFLVLLVRREVPSKIYILQPPAGEGQPASFLQSSPPEGGTVTAEAERPPQS